MTSTIKVTIAALAMMSMPALAADIPTVMTGIKGVWSTEDGCRRLKLAKINPKALWEKGFEDTVYLDGKGVEGYEWSCRFTKGFDGDGFYLSNCEIEGEGWTDILKLEEIKTGGWSVIALDADNKPNAILFDTQCKASK